MTASWSIGSRRGVAAGENLARRAALDEAARLLAAPPAPRMALKLTEAAAALDVSKNFFDEHIRPELRVVRRGRKVLVSVRELERWLDENAALTLAEERWR